MRKTYKCSNIKFCMEDENQRRTWEYLQSVTRKDGSYGKILSDVFVLILDGKNRAAAGECSIVEPEQSEPDLRKVEEFLEELLEDKLQRLQEDLAGRIECNAALYSRQKKHFIFDSINTITAHSFR